MMTKLAHILLGSAMLIGAASANAATYNIGVLDSAPFSITNPYVNNASVTGTFLDTYNFSLKDTSLVSNSLNQLTLSLGPTNILNINGLVLDLYNASNQLQATVTGTGQETKTLANGSYSVNILGTTTGLAGGNYTFSAAAEPVPEPDGWMMLIAGLGLMGFMVRRRKSEQA